MSAVLRTIASVLVGYLFGTLPVADSVSRLASPDGPDLRTVGSHNPGALNVGKSLGTTWGAVVLGADIGKGWFAAIVGRRFGGATAANLAAAAAVAGHTHPIGRDGGKGVATSIGQVIGTFPTYLPVDVGVAAATAALPRWTQRTWAATAVASSVWISASTLAWRRRWSTGIDDPAPFALPFAAAASSALIASRFARNPLVDGRPRVEETR